MFSDYGFVIHNDVRFFNLRKILLACHWLGATEQNYIDVQTALDKISPGNLMALPVLNTDDPNKKFVETLWYVTLEGVIELTTDSANLFLNLFLNKHSVCKNNFHILILLRDTLSKVYPIFSIRLKADFNISCYYRNNELAVISPKFDQLDNSEQENEIILPIYNMGIDFDIKLFLETLSVKMAQQLNITYEDFITKYMCVNNIYKHD